MTEGPPRYYLPVCVNTPLGFIGGPSGYQEVGEDERDRGPVIVEERSSPMTPEESRAYSRGYSAGSRGHWPLHRPPVPPHKVVSRLMTAARDLRDEVDGTLATLCEDDEWQEPLGPLVDAVDVALTRIGTWLLSEE